MKNFLKVLDKNDAAFQHLWFLFLALNSSKNTRRAFSSEFQIWEVQKDKVFEDLLTLIEMRAWKAFKSDYNGFLGNTCVPDWQECIENLLQSYEDMGCRMPLKIHSFQFLNFFSPHLWVMSLEKGFTNILLRWKVTTKTNRIPTPCGEIC